MEVITHNINDTKIAEIIASDVLLATPEEGLDLLGNLLKVTKESI